jgi:hypothetical protein
MARATRRPTSLIIRSSIRENRPKGISPSHPAGTPDRLSSEISVATDAKLATRLQLAEELEIGAVHVVTRGGAG